ARMAAALRTPSLKYRSFGNEPVRNPPVAPATSEEQAFSILGDALAGASDLPPDAVLSDTVPRAPVVPTETPMLAARDDYAAHPEPIEPEASVYDASVGIYPAAPDPYAELHRVAAPAVPQPDVAPVPVAPSPVMPSQTIAPPVLTPQV